MNRKRAILGALLGVLAVCLIYAYLATPRLEKAPPRAAEKRQQPVNQKSSEEGGQTEPSGRIDFAYLSSNPQEFAGVKRDVFRFGQRRPVKTAPTAPVVKKEVRKPLVMPVVVPAEVMQKSLSQFTFLGFLEKGGAKTVFLSSSGNLFLVKQGEHFGVSREFLVVQIDDKLLKVRHADREGLIEIQLIEKQKLNAAVSAPVSVSRSASPAIPAVSPRSHTGDLSRARRIVRPVTRQEGQDFQNQEAQDFQSQEDQDFQSDSNSWPETRRQGMTETYNP